MNCRAEFAGRLEGPAKVAGTLAYEGDVLPLGMLHAALVEARIPRGRVVAIDDGAARAMTSFVDLIGPADAKSLRPSAATSLIQSDMVHFAGQGLAMVVAETRLDAMEAARRVLISYEEQLPVTSMHHPDAAVYAPAMTVTATRQRSRASETSSTASWVHQARKGSGPERAGWTSE